MAEVPPLHKLALTAPTAEPVRLGNCSQKREKPDQRFGPVVGWEKGYQSLLADIKKFLSEVKTSDPAKFETKVPLHIVDGSNLMFVNDFRILDIPIPEGVPQGLPIVIMKMGTYNMLTNSGQGGSACFLEKLEPLHLSTMPMLVVTIDVLSTGDPKLDAIREAKFLVNKRNVLAYDDKTKEEDDACAIMPKKYSDDDKFWARKAKMYQHYYCEYDDVLATELWKALATTGVTNLNRSDKIVSTDANVNKWEPKDDDRTEALNKLRETELRRQLDSTLAVLKELANAVVLRMFTIMPRTTPAPAAPSKPPAAGGNPYPEINRRGARSNPPSGRPGSGRGSGRGSGPGKRASSATGGSARSVH